MSGRQRIVRVRRQYNQWVANQTLEDYALRFTAKNARRWSNFRVANTALGAISFLACEAIGATITLNFGFTNAVAATLVVGLLIFATALPIAYHAVKHGVDIDLLTRGAGFGYIGSTVTSLVYASFTFIFFAIEAAIMAMALQLCFGIPLSLGYILCSLIVIPIVTHGIRAISWLQLWSQPVWIVLQFLPLAVIALTNRSAVDAWAAYPGVTGLGNGGFDILTFGAAASVVMSLVAQIGEQVDFLRFLPPYRRGGRVGWWAAMVAAGPGWIIICAIKILVGSFLAVLAIGAGLSATQATQPTDLYRIAFGYICPSPRGALLLVGVFVILSQIKINVTNSYAGSIAWSNFFSRLTHSHPGRVVWLVFNVALALILMELDIFRAIDRILGLYANFAVAWIGALVADLVINKPLGLSPPTIEFRRAYLYDFNPVGVGSMIISLTLSTVAYFGVMGPLAQALAPFLGLAVSFVAAPLIALVTRGRFYIARGPDAEIPDQSEVQCCICAHKFESEDMAYCPAYAGPICSLCCTLDARCHDSCKENGRLIDRLMLFIRGTKPRRIVYSFRPRFGHFLAMLLLFVSVISVTLMLNYFQYSDRAELDRAAIRNVLTAVFFCFLMIGGVGAWLMVLVNESRRVAEEETARQTDMLMQEIEAHKRTDARLQQTNIALNRAREVAESANEAKSRYIVGISHEIRAPLNAIFGYAQLLERAPSVPAHERDGVRVIRRSAQHLINLIDGMLDISKIEAGRLQLYRDAVRFGDFLDQIVDMFRLQAEAKGLSFIYDKPADLPVVVHADENRLRQILINLLSNAIKYTDMGEVRLCVRYRSEVASFEVSDTGHGIRETDLGRIFQAFERGHMPRAQTVPGTGLGLTITKMLIEIMGGEITVHSVPEHGSVFRIRLFLPEGMNPEDLSGPASAPDEPVGPPAWLIKGYAGRRRTILIADDDPAQLDMLYELLAPLGFIIFSASDGAAALHLMRQCEAELVLLDLSMPNYDGWEVARRMRQEGFTDAVIIMVSANVGEYSLLTRGLQAEADAVHDGFLLKPIEVQRLIDRIGALCQIEWIYDRDAVPAVEASEPTA